MIIINADDWGRSVPDTDAALSLFKARRITSVSAMVFMRDSERAAALANEHGVDVGLHLNFCESFDAPDVPTTLANQQALLVDFLNGSRFSQLVYNLRLRRVFDAACKAQFEEFYRLYGRMPSHVDGHRHLHLCANVLVDGLIPKGSRVRRSFSFAPGEKGLVNRTYRRIVDARLSSRYVLTDYFFSLQYCLADRPAARVAALARSANVEVMTHPRDLREFEFLAGDRCHETFHAAPKGTYADLGAAIGDRHA